MNHSCTLPIGVFPTKFFNSALQLLDIMGRGEGGIIMWIMVMTHDYFSVSVSCRLTDQSGVCSKPEETLCCPSCHRRFPDQLKMRAHQEAAHPHLQRCKHACAQCGKRFVSRSKLRLHQLTHEGAKKFACEHCNSTFSDPSNLNRHRKLHQGKNLATESVRRLPQKKFNLSKFN